VRKTGREVKKKAYIQTHVHTSRLASLDEGIYVSVWVCVCWCALQQQLLGVKERGIDSLSTRQSRLLERLARERKRDSEVRQRARAMDGVWMFLGNKGVKS